MVGRAFVALAGVLVLAPMTGGFAAAEPTGEIPVDSAGELTDALAEAGPGDTIRLAPGSYEGEFVAGTAGTREAPITLTGARDAVLSNEEGYGLHLDGAAHWKLTGFGVRSATKGIVLDGSDHVLIDGVEVADIEGEAVHFRSASSDNVIQNSVIHDIGTVHPEYGEGIYFGSAKNNWEDGPDRSDRNQALNNTIGPNVAAESVDIKEGTEGGLVRGNTFDAHGIAGENAADSWIDVKGNGYTIEGNTGVFDGDGALVDGYQTHTKVDGYGCGTIFRDNDSDLGGADGYAINVTNADECESAPNIVSTGNSVRNAGSGLTNVEPTPAPGTIAGSPRFGVP